MPEEKKKKKIIGLRTFADDVRRAKTGDVTEPTTQHIRPQASPTHTVVPTNTQAAERSLEKAVSAIMPAATKNIKKELQKKSDLIEIPAEDKQDDTPMNVPPFHNLHKSSSENTTYKDTHEIPDKDVTQKNTKVTHTKINAEVLGIDTDIVKNTQSSVLSATRDSIFDTEEAETNIEQGTIVTDRKREKFKLAPAVAKSLSGWITEKVDEVEEAQYPKHEIVKSIRRKDTINEAANYAKLAPTDDHTTVAERLKNIERITAADKLTIKDDVDVPAPTWSHTDENEARHTELETTETKKPETNISATQPIHKDITKPTLPVSQHTQEPIAQTQHNPTKPNTTSKISPQTAAALEEPTTPRAVLDTVSQENIPVLKQPPVPTPIQQEKAIAAPTPPQKVIPETPLDVEAQPSFARRPVPEYRLNKAGQPAPLNNSGTPYLTFTAVIIVAVLLGVATSAWLFMRDTSSTPVVATQEPSRITSQTIVSVPLATNQTAFYQELQAIVANNQVGTIEIKPVVGEVGASNEQIFSTLNVHAPGNFVRNVSRITFGATGDRAPFIVMNIHSFDIAFAGILAWEPNMAADFAPLFGSAARTNSYDTKVSNHDVRVLTSDGSHDHITYGFLDKNTLLITTSREVYTKLIPYINQ